MKPPLISSKISPAHWPACRSCTVKEEDPPLELEDALLEELAEELDEVLDDDELLEDALVEEFIWGALPPHALINAVNKTNEHHLLIGFISGSFGWLIIALSLLGLFRASE